MVEQFVKPGQKVTDINVVDFAAYQRGSRPRGPLSIEARVCRHCGAALLDDESEDDCSSAGLALQSPIAGPLSARRPPRRFRAE
ncbi:hypothetical protein [Rhodopseudomonas sp. B29]|uniref:hypothetical protein n=1 Tax=Rhodopseudomonas sp. B29 TaxID=95607 RepID=UPI0003471AFD|nr:hypothetical protein [Rhodopseudomonas sp. B29]